MTTKVPRPTPSMWNSMRTGWRSWMMMMMIIIMKKGRRKCRLGRRRRTRKPSIIMIMDMDIPMMGEVMWSSVSMFVSYGCMYVCWSLCRMMVDVPFVHRFSSQTSSSSSNAAPHIHTKREETEKLACQKEPPLTSNDILTQALENLLIEKVRRRRRRRRRSHLSP